MKLSPVQLLIVAGAVFAGYMVWKRQKAANTTTESDTPAAAEGLGAWFNDFLGGAGAATAPAPTPAPATGTTTDNGT